MRVVKCFMNLPYRQAEEIIQSWAAAIFTAMVFSTFIVVGADSVFPLIISKMAGLTATILSLWAMLAYCGLTAICTLMALVAIAPYDLRFFFTCPAATSDEVGKLGGGS